MVLEELGCHVGSRVLLLRPIRYQVSVIAAGDRTLRIARAMIATVDEDLLLVRHESTKHHAELPVATVCSLTGI